jgi:hypothetical protein
VEHDTAEQRRVRRDEPGGRVDDHASLTTSGDGRSPSAATTSSTTRSTVTASGRTTTLSASIWTKNRMSSTRRCRFRAARSTRPTDSTWSFAIGPMWPS